MQSRDKKNPINDYITPLNISSTQSISDLKTKPEIFFIIKN